MDERCILRAGGGKKERAGRPARGERSPRRPGKKKRKGSEAEARRGRVVYGRLVEKARLLRKRSGGAGHPSTRRALAAVHPPASLTVTRRRRPNTLPRRRVRRLQSYSLRPHSALGDTQPNGDALFCHGDPLVLRDDPFTQAAISTLTHRRVVLHGSVQRYRRKHGRRQRTRSSETTQPS